MSLMRGLVQNSVVLTGNMRGTALDAVNDGTGGGGSSTTSFRARQQREVNIRCHRPHQSVAASSIPSISTAIRPMLRASTLIIGLHGEGQFHGCTSRLHLPVVMSAPFGSHCGHQPGGFAGAENIDTADKRRLCFCAETGTIGAHQIVLFPR